MPSSNQLRRVPVAIATAIALCLAVPASASALNAYAAASLREVLPQIDRSPTYNFAGSNVLETQIRRGAPADVFLAASVKEPQALFRAGRCTRPVTFATNKVVLLVPRTNAAGIRSVYTLRRGGLRLSIGNRGVPIGDYTRQLLRRLGLSRVLTTNTVSNESNVANVVSKVALGSADAGFAYVTDGRIASDRVRAIRLPTYAQPPVRYQMCRVVRSGVDAAGAQAFINRVRSDSGRRTLRAAGFGVPRR
ncbi:MAG: molybdate ABC transporter substrate-binding protein [Solirubrobacteraceae bacterium]|nr:molybdate ABC transporter substrate-binding protein [Solirubrobacteraceae bacterium]